MKICHFSVLKKLVDLSICFILILSFYHSRVLFSRIIFQDISAKNPYGYKEIKMEIYIDRIQ